MLYFDFSKYIKTNYFLELEPAFEKTLFEIVEKYYIVTFAKELQFVLISPHTAATLGFKTMSENSSYWFVGALTSLPKCKT